MLKNNNQKVISGLARRSLKNNRRRSLIVIAAIVLSAFMLFTVLTVGVTYFKMQRLQDMRMNGAEYDAMMYGATDEQLQMCEDNPDISATGIAAVAGFAVATEADSTINVGFLWADDTYWNQMKEPARDWVKGDYPKSADEIMVTRESLKECGMEALEVGDSFRLKYNDANGEHEKEFKISGMWDGYGEKKVFYVSRAFYEACGHELSSVASGRYFMEFKQSIMPPKAQDQFIESMNLDKQQRIFFVSDFSYSVQILVGMAGLILITCFSAYLLIYNIMYLSVSGNIRYYGLLQTVGMSGRQIRSLIQKQMLLMGAVGIGIGIIAGSVVSLFLIPEIIKLLGIQTGDIQIAFHPAIFVLTLIITGLTIYSGSRKPAKLAVSISPIEATGYRPLNGQKVTRRTGKGKLMWRMAKDQLTKDKKKSAVVILSLATSLSVFLCLITLIESQGARTIMSNYMNMDMVIKNDTLALEDRNDWAELLDKEFIAGLDNNAGISEVNPVLSAEVTVPWEPEFSDRWMREFYDMWMTIPYEDEVEEYKTHPENFGTFLIGINENEFEYMNEDLSVRIDRERFLAGETCILYRNGLDFKTSDLAGQQITCAEYLDQTNTRSFEVAGLTDETYYVGSLLGYPPIMIVSDKVVAEFTESAKVAKAGIKYRQEYDKDAEGEILTAMRQSPYAKDFSYESKIDEMETLKSAQGNMMEIGIGIVVIFALIGILNYINTVTGNIQSRQVELAIMESVGMTETQTNKMLVLEGISFAMCSLILTATVGLGTTYAIYQSMNYQNIAFAVPVLPMLGMVVFITAVCVLIPLVTRQILVKSGSVMERIRGFE